MSEERYRNFIDGTWVEATTNGRVSVVNPATEETIDSVVDSSAADVDAAVAAARAAQSGWGKLPAAERATHLRAIAQRVRGNADALARLISLEQGKTLGLAGVEVAFAASYLEYMAEWARRIEGEIIESDRQGEQILLYRRPIGVVAGILPWNFPFFMIARKLAPALITGNTAVIKASEETPLSAIEFAKLVAQTDLPAGVFNLLSGARDTGAALAAHSDVGMVSFTGSVGTGSRIMQACAANLTKVNLELGGKAPAIVLADCDLDLAANALFQSRVINAGQVCNCAERVYVERKVADALTDKLVALMRGVRFGDPLADPSVDMGPLINKTAAQKVDAMVQEAVKQGAELLTGGKAGDRAGYFFEPTVLANCSQNMAVMQKEIFGPVLPIQVVDSLDEALVRANDSEYGLTSSVFTSHLSSAMKACAELKFGETYVNREHFEAMQGFHAGRRKSGIGGADGKHGVYEFTETHVVYLQS